MTKFIVIGSMMEHIAHLHVEAESAEEALAAYKAEFPDCHEGWWSVDVTSLDERPDLLHYWKGNGDRYYSGGYKYTF